MGRGPPSLNHQTQSIVASPHRRCFDPLCLNENDCFPSSSLSELLNAPSSVMTPQMGTSDSRGRHVYRTPTSECGAFACREDHCYINQSGIWLLASLHNCTALYCPTYMGKVHTPKSETGCSRFQRKHPTSGNGDDVHERQQRGYAMGIARH